VSTLIPIFGISHPAFRAHFSYAVAVCLSALASPVCRAQELGPPARTPLQTSAELVKVDVSVLDKHGNFIAGLSQNEFRVLDRGAAQPIVAFAPVEAPAQMLVMIETSPAVYLIHNEHLAAAYALLDGLASDDQVALVAYDQTPRVLLAFTPEKSALLAALGRLQYTIGMGDLNFYDSLSTVLDWLAPVTGKRALVLLTTGLDSSPPARWDALARKLRGSDVVIFPVALGGSLRGDTNKKSKAKRSASKLGEQETVASREASGATGFARADAALRSLAAMTGGRAYFPESDKDFVPIYHEIVSALRHQYVLGIVPAHDGQFHALTVEVLGNNGQPVKQQGRKAAYRVLAREGYLAPGP
jgi:Ca-activated chloride channel homolog